LLLARIDKKANERGEIEQSANQSVLCAVDSPFKNAENEQDDNSNLHSQISFGFKCCPSLDVFIIA
jgi:hypothetical protein